MQDARIGRAVVARKGNRNNMQGTCLLALVLIWGSIGCGASMAEQMGHSWFTPPKGLPAFDVDVRASSVEYDGNNSPEMSDATELRDVIATQLRERLGRAVSGPDAQSARFRARYRVTRQVWPLTWWVLCVDLQLVGCPTGQASVDTEIDFQVGNFLYRGHGSGFAVGGLYYGRLTGTLGALAEATEDALRHLAYLGTVSRSAAASTSSGGIQ